MIYDRFIALGFAPEGDKEHRGDGLTPEGVLRIDRDWTAGGIAVAHDVMNVLWPVVGVGTLVEVRP